MRILICGAGQVGYGIAERLSRENNDVSVIDSSPELIQNIQDRLDVRGYVGHGAHPDVLHAAGAENADMIIAVTLYDEVNMVACQVAHSLFRVPTKIARIRAQSYKQAHWQHLFSTEHMPIDVIISPEIEVAEVIFRRIALPGARDIVMFNDETVAMVAIECDEDCPVIDTPLAQLTELFPDLNAVVAGIARGGEVFTPRSVDQIQQGDIAYLIAERGQIRRTISIFGKEQPESSRIVLAGGGNIGVYLAGQIEKRLPQARVKIIENSRSAAEKLAEQLNRTIVLHGNALDETVLLEAGVETANLMVSITNNDQVNILSSVMANRLGCARNLALLNNVGYHDFTKTLGIDDFINPRSITISRVLQYVRRGRIRGVYSIQNGLAEIVEGEALEASPLVGKPLRELHLPDGIRIGMIAHEGEIYRPNGESIIRPNDRIVIFALSNRLHEVEQMFRVSSEYI